MPTEIEPAGKEGGMWVYLDKNISFKSVILVSGLKSHAVQGWGPVDWEMLLSSTYQGPPVLPLYKCTYKRQATAFTSCHVFLPGRTTKRHSPHPGTYVVLILVTYRSRALLGACAYNSTGRKYAPISEMRLITHIIIKTFLE